MKMKLIKNILSAKEIMNTAYNMTLQDTYMEREMCKVLMVANIMLSDYEVNKTEKGMVEISAEQYDELNSKGAIHDMEQDILNYADIDKEYESLVSTDTSMRNMLISAEKTLTTIDKKVSQMNTKNLSLDTILTQVKGAVSTIKNSESLGK